METINKLSIIITLPKTVDWDDYKSELYKAATGEILNFKVSNFPTEVRPGDKCYLVHDGYIKGWHEIYDFAENDFTCTTTGKKWKGKFIQRTGPFHFLEDPVPMKGFQGWRYFSMDSYLEDNKKPES